ncbi:MAG: hypothetical protein GY809_33165 [Planctomycetes bacterium]|nr:hypothetical protein [Planctomycetota bacterium]
MKSTDPQSASPKQGIKNLHLAGTLWFVVSVGFILATGLRNAGADWWVIFYLSGPYAVTLFVLVSLYLFALYRGSKPTQALANEHPLTASEYYLVLYTSAPLLGAVAGTLHAILYRPNLYESVCNIAAATFYVTFASWVILDPILASLETFTPRGRAYREKRLEKQRAERLEKQRNRDALLELLIQKEKENEAIWTQTLTPYVPELCDLLNTSQSEFSNAEKRAAEIAIEAWRLGGLACMQFLHSRTLAVYQEKHPNRPLADYIMHWWDGIGAWKNPNTI